MSQSHHETHETHHIPLDKPCQLQSTVRGVRVIEGDLSMDMQFELPTVSVATVPTLKQFLQQLGDKKLKQKYLVMKVWFPNKFPYLTLITEDWKVSLAESSDLYPRVDDLLREVISTDTAIALKLTPGNLDTYTFTTSSEKGVWSPVGNSGQEFILKSGRIRAK